MDSHEAKRTDITKAVDIPDHVENSADEFGQLITSAPAAVTLEEFLRGLRSEAFSEFELDLLLFHLICEELDAIYAQGRSTSFADLAVRFPRHDDLVERAWLAVPDPRPTVPELLATLDDDSPLRTGEVFHEGDPRFAIELRAGSDEGPGWIGTGNFGSVWAGYDRALDCPVAIKVPHRSRIRTPEDRQNVLQEARKLREFNHRNIVRVFDVVSTADRMVAIVMELCDEQSLRSVIREQAAQTHDLAWCLDVIRQLAQAIDHMHERQWRHCDLKPGNVVFRDGVPKIVDFGLALHISDQLAQKNQLWGTRRYFSPEHAAGGAQGFDQRTDIFSLAIIAFELLTGGIHPFAESPESTEDEIFLRLSDEKIDANTIRQFNRNVDPDTEKLILTCLSRRKLDRPSTAQDVADQIQPAEGSSVISDSESRSAIVRSQALVRYFKAFPDRSSHLFGRKPDLRYLAKRISTRGLTAVRARPKMGKTWMLQELGRVATSAEDYLVGYYECRGATTNALETVFVDLYSRWLADDVELERVRALWHKYKLNYHPAVTGPLSVVFESAPNHDVRSIGDLIHMIAGGGTRQATPVPCATLQYDHAVELLHVVADFTEKRIVLILDAWEQSSSLDTEARLLTAFLANLEECPKCHVVVSLRPDHPAGPVADELSSSSPSAAVYNLPPMHLDDQQTQRSICRYLKQNVPAASVVDDGTLLSMINAFPGVLSNWLSDHGRNTMQNEEDLQSEATAANEYRYREFNDLLPCLKPDERALAIRVALSPPLDTSAWQYVRQPILGDIPESTIDELFIKRVFEGGLVPGFGHQTRHFAAASWLVLHEQYKNSVGREVEQLIRRFACGFDRYDSRSIVACLQHVADFHHATHALGLSNDARVLCIAAQNFISEEEHKDSTRLLTNGCAVAQQNPEVAELICMGFLRLQYHRRDNAAVGKRDEPIDALRSICSVIANEFTLPGLASALYFAAVYHPKPPDRAEEYNAVVQKVARPGSNYLAIGTVAPNHPPGNQAEWSRHDRALDELRELCTQHSGTPELHKYLAMALFVSGLYRVDGASTRYETCLNELENLAQKLPEDEAVRGILGMALVNVLRVEPSFELIQHVVEKLLALAEDERHAYEWHVSRASLLRYVVNRAADVRKFEVRDEYLDDLRVIVAKYPADESVRLYLAQAVFTVHIHAKEEDDLQRRDELLTEIRELHQHDPEHARIRAYCAKTMLHTLNHAKLEGDLGRRDALLNELREMAEQYAPDEDVLENLAMGVANTVINATTDEELGTVDRLVGELRELDQRFRQNDSVRENLSTALRSAHIHAREAKRTDVANSHLKALRELESTSPVKVAVNYAAALDFKIAHQVKTEKGHKKSLQQAHRELRRLANTYEDAERIHRNLAFATYNLKGKLFKLTASKQRKQFLSTLRIAWKRHCDSVPIAETLATGLLDAFNAIRADHSRKEQTKLLEELRMLTRRFPDNVEVVLHTGKAICNTIAWVDEKETVDEHVTEIETMVGACEGNPVVMEPLAKAMYNGIRNSLIRGDVPPAYSLLDRLRTLHRRHPTDECVAIEFVGAMMNTFSARSQDPSARELIIEIHDVTAAFRPDVPLDKGMTMGKLNSMVAPFLEMAALETDSES